MAVKYTNIFNVTHAITHEPCTILVETIDPIGGDPLVVIKTIEGEYETREEFEDARKYSLEGWERGYARDKGERKWYSSITLLISGTRHLVDSLNEALQTCEEG